MKKNCIRIFLTLSILFPLFAPHNVSAENISYTQAVVKIHASNEGALFYYLGSGSLIDDQFHVLTNAHVIYDNESNKVFNEIFVSFNFSDLEEPYCNTRAEVLKYDVALDLAVLDLVDDPENECPEYRTFFADKSLTFYDVVGELNDQLYMPHTDTVIKVFGYPIIGGNTLTISRGVVSGYLLDTAGKILAIKTDAAISPGNSGGMALSDDNQFIGVPSRKRMLDNDELGLIIPAEKVYQFLLSAHIQNETNSCFPDVTQGSLHEKAICELKRRGIIRGYDDGTFGENNPVTRNELMKFVVNGVLGQDPESSVYNNCFPDVSGDKWSVPFVCYGKKKNMISGYSDGTFKGDNRVSRIEAIKIVMNGFKFPIPEAMNDSPFNDIAADHWSVPFVKRTIDMKLMDHFDAYFYPDNSMTRGDIAELIYRGLMVTEEGVQYYGQTDKTWRDFDTGDFISNPSKWDISYGADTYDVVFFNQTTGAALSFVSNDSEDFSTLDLNELLEVVYKLFLTVDAKVLSNREMNFKGYTAKQMVVSLNLNDQDVKMQITFFVKDGVLYSFSYASLIDSFQESLTDANAIMNSFEFGS